MVGVGVVVEAGDKVEVGSGTGDGSGAGLVHQAEFRAIRAWLVVVGSLPYSADQGKPPSACC